MGYDKLERNLIDIIKENRLSLAFLKKMSDFITRFLP